MYSLYIISVGAKIQLTVLMVTKWILGALTVPVHHPLKNPEEKNNLD